ncbi:hypothetical protein ABS71_17375 [bacterium SCN 62-11]|nr:CHAT domain-containing protein [Candidatus Eremiobacteraeota bacterium]ODT60361.1 MAG: hypothetical protein ABS71_17375 [bacterium SCN 62-11]
MKRFLIASLLLGGLAWAQQPTPAQFEAECNRLEPLLKDYDPGCPARLAALRRASQDLRPGPERAHYFWLAATQADLMDDRQTRNRLRFLALAEPGVPAPRMANWLRLTLTDSTLQQPDHNRLLQQLSSLYEAHPDDEILWQLQMAQARSAEHNGQESLARTLRLGALRMAERHRWYDRQLDYWLEDFPPLAPEKWQGGLRVAVASKRPDLCWRVLGACATLDQWNRAVQAFPGRPDPLKLEQRFAEVFARVGSRVPALNHDQRGQKWAHLVQVAQAAGRVEEEISARQAYGANLCKAGHIKLGLRQMEAALQLRLDHPLTDPDWAPNSRRLGSLALELADTAYWYDQSQKAMSAAENILDRGWDLRFPEQYRLFGLLFKIAKTHGDLPAMNRYWAAQLQRVEQWPDFIRGEVLGELLRRIPPGQDKDVVVRRLRQWSEATLNSPDSPAGLRWNAALYLAEALAAQGDKAGTERLWRAELDRARERGDQDMLEHCTRSLGQVLHGQDRIPEFKSLLQGRLQAAGVGESEKRDLLSWLASVLASKKDPDALALADQLIGLCQKPGIPPDTYRYARRTQAQVLSSFGRYPSALQALDQAGSGPGGLVVVRDSEGHSIGGGGSFDTTRANILWKMGRQEESLALLESFLKSQLASEVPQIGPALKQWMLFRQERGEEWQSAYARALEELSRRSGVAPTVAGAVEHDWLQALAAKQLWEEGRQVLLQYPWKLTALDSYTRALQAHSAWSDLLPAPQPAAQAPAPPDSLSQVVDELRLAHPELGQWLSLRSTNLKHLQARLGPRDTLVTYCALGEEVYVLALRQDGGYSVHSHAPQWKARLRDYLANLKLEQQGAAESDLFRLLVQPVLRQDPQQRLYVVPTGELWQLPFGALRDERGQSLASQAEVVMLSSGDLLRLADNSWQPYRLSQPLAIGAPPDADLPGAYQELAEVSALLPGCQLKRGPQATSQVLYDPNQQWGLVHFASHAHYRVDRPTESDIQLSDGPLRLKQLNRMSLAEHSLVTLSCCQGGAAAGQTLEEPVTLATGFSAAGAETVVANLWKVDDEVARLFFAEFYGQLAQGQSPVQSFRAAQTNCRRQYPKTLDWGGFFLLGNPT